MQNLYYRFKTFKIDWTLFLTLLGVIAAWVPFLYDRLNPNVIKGKIISQYGNIGTFAGEHHSIFLFKISVVSLNQSFNLKDIDIDINFEKHGWTHNSAINQRSTFFTLENKLKKLTVPEESFLNNLTILKKDEPVVGYIMTTSAPYNEKYVELQFIFKSFDDKEKILSFKVNDYEGKLFYDDSIWQPIDDSTVGHLPIKIL